jgi:nicotinate phosphoribosyltransferase
VEGIPTVKLSDNPKKSVGPVDVVERYRRVFGTVAVDAVEVVV